MTQTLIVALIVTTAALYSGWSLMPAVLRRSAAAFLARHAGRVGMGDDTARQIQARLAASGTCSDCNSCGACATPADKSAATKVSVVKMPQRGVHRSPG